MNKLIKILAAVAAVVTSVAVIWTPVQESYQWYEAKLQRIDSIPILSRAIKNELTIHAEMEDFKKRLDTLQKSAITIEMASLYAKDLSKALSKEYEVSFYGITPIYYADDSSTWVMSDDFLRPARRIRGEWQYKDLTGEWKPIEN